MAKSIIDTLVNFQKHGTASLASAMIERRYLYFPDTKIQITPESAKIYFEDVIFQSLDGLQLHGWFVPGQPKRPVVLFCHGNAGNMSNRVPMIRFLNNLGLSVFIFDYRGYGNSKGRVNENGTYDDARGALRWLLARGWSTSEMIFLGRSLGAAVALQIAIEKPPARLVLECPFTSIVEMAQLHYPRLYRLFRGLVRAKYSNVSKIKAIRSPLLLCHGTDDRIVPCVMGERLYDLAPRPKRLLLAKGGGHSDGDILGNPDYYATWHEFSDLKRPHPENDQQEQIITC
ncbi:MAG: alpha/beta hydrolase [Deltaproteobacteria bacterium]|nr:alpha/beta hydrolase [Deltaproteobacteria bacterium]